MNANGSAPTYSSTEGYDPHHPAAFAPVQQPQQQSADPAAAAAKARSAAPKQKKRLACGACRARRIKCEWPETGAGCVACSLANLRCPGEPEPRKKTKKSEAGPQQPPSAIIRTQDGLSRFALGGALTFHLIESLFLLANPHVPGMSYNLYRDLLHASGGSSREAEIAAECLCSAMIASSATFSDHPIIVGTGDIETPTEMPEGGAGANEDFEKYLAYGTRRKDAVKALANRSYALFDESGIKDRPGIETIYTLLALDQCANLTTDDGRKSRDFVKAAADQMRHMLARASEVSERQLVILQGALGRHIISLDAQTAATCREGLILSNHELEALLPQIDVYQPPHVGINPSLLLERETGWTELGKQLAPMQVAVAGLYRKFVAEREGIATNEHSLAFLWNSLDSGAKILDSCSAHVNALPPLDSSEETAHRQFDYQNLITSHRRALLQLDLVLHQTIVEAAMQTATAAGGDGHGEGEHQISEIVFQSYETSSSRTRKTFASCVALMSQHVDNRSLQMARKLLDVMEVCSTWSSLRMKADQESAVQCVIELGLSEQDCRVLISGLSLAAWSCPSAVKQIEGIKLGMPRRR
ncbi:hypothetical protein ACM66B_004962 [Microbotryomycetes sp. NB124-2]